MDFSEVDPVGRSEVSSMGNLGFATNLVWSWPRPGIGAAARITCCFQGLQVWGKPLWR